MKLCSLIMLITLSISTNTRTGFFSQQTEEERLLHKKSKVELKRVESYLKEIVMCGGEQNPEMDSLVAQYLTPIRYKKWWCISYHTCANDHYVQLDKDIWHTLSMKCRKDFTFYMFNLIKGKPNEDEYLNNIRVFLDNDTKVEHAWRPRDMACYYAFFTQKKLGIMMLSSVITYLVPPCTPVQVVEQHLNATPDDIITRLYNDVSFFKQDVRQTLACWALDKGAKPTKDLLQKALFKNNVDSSDWIVAREILQRNQVVAADFTLLYGKKALARVLAYRDILTEPLPDQPLTSLAVLASTSNAETSSSGVHQRSRRLACEDEDKDLLGD